MEGQAEFKHDMLEALAGIIKTYHLAVADTNNHGILLVGKDFGVEMGFEREGIGLVYFDLRPPPNRHRYSLGHFLVQVRRVPHPPSVWSQGEGSLLNFWRHEMPWVVDTLQRHAQDILSGDRAWQADYPYKPHVATDAMYKEALETMERERKACHLT